MDSMQIEAIRMIMRPTEIELNRQIQAAAPDPMAVDRFNALMSTEISSANIAQAPREVSPVPFADRLCKTFFNAQVQQAETRGRIQEIISREPTVPLSQIELMKLQYEVTNLAFQQDVVSKVIDRSNQAIQSLFKNQ